MAEDGAEKTVMVLAIASAVGGLLAHVWLGDWRWTVTGLGLMVVFAAAGVALERRG